MWSVTTSPCASLTSIETERASAEAKPISPAMRMSQATSAKAALLSAASRPAVTASTMSWIM